MINTVLFGVNVILVVAVWHYIYRSAAKHAARVELMVLRGEAYDEFAARDALNNPALVELDRFLEHATNQVHRATMWRLIVSIAAAQTDAEFRKVLNSRIERRFDARDSDLQEVVDRIRSRAHLQFLEYAVRTSVLGSLLAHVVIGPILFGYKTGRFLLQAARPARHGEYISVGRHGLAAACAALIAITPGISSVFAKLLTRDAVEKSVLGVSSPSKRSPLASLIG